MPATFSGDVATFPVGSTAASFSGDASPKFIFYASQNSTYALRQCKSLWKTCPCYISCDDLI